MEKKVHINTEIVDWVYSPAKIESLQDVLDIMAEADEWCEAVSDTSLEEALQNCIHKTEEWAKGINIMNDYENQLDWADKADKLRKAYAWLKAHRTHNIVTDGI